MIKLDGWRNKVESSEDDIHRFVALNTLSPLWVDDDDKGVRQIGLPCLDRFLDGPETKLLVKQSSTRAEW